MRAPDWDDALLLEHRRHLQSENAQQAFDCMVDAAQGLSEYECAPGWHGAIRDFRYIDRTSGERPFAFIVNRSDLLFYVRKSGLHRVRGGFRRLQEWFSDARVNNRGEWAVRITNAREAQLLESFLFDPVAPASSEVRKATPMSEPIRRPAALVKQGTLRLYTTSLQASQLLRPGFYDIERLDPANAHDKGYQRVLNTARAKRLGDYLLSGQEHHDAFLPTSIFLATDKELRFDAEQNVLEIDSAKVGSFSVVDGQHRLEGLRYAAEKDPKIGSFEVAVNIAVGLSKIAQMCHFLIVNTTQKSVDKAVEQRLTARLTDMVEVEDVPTLPRWIRRVVESGDDAQALRLIDYLNQTPDSPWYRKIAMPNAPSDGTTINQKSFVVAVKRYVLAASNPLMIRAPEQQERIFLNYWRAISEELGTDDETVLFKSIGVDLFSRFSGTVFGKLQDKQNYSVSTIRALLRRTFDNMDGDYAGLGQPDWWLSGSGPAGGLNASALGKVNQELAQAMHRAESGSDIVL